MKNLSPDTELETELQELYTMSRHLQDDILFLEGEERFFKEVLNKCGVQADSFRSRIEANDQLSAASRVAVQEFLSYLAPYITEKQKAIDMDMLNRYNNLQSNIKDLFAAIKQTKNELFAYAETAMLGNIAIPTH
ncbi:hypothetical protein [Mucilaginibacter pedocola]|uniref:Uncharacterized protein n=1 Tax=Mucilaginibacter pedocola TaxID=1792845 RepID=A0A1S9P7S1_9SPHI|nr:hypothetical protein [Mucilaginibacter pedocola]OOQ56698.1 hypothetical protein BC343_17020 [Mucilaginibacter pedocola]